MLFFWRRIRKLLEKEDSQVKIGISNVYGANASVLDAFREAVTAIKSRIYKRESLIFAKEIKQEDFSEYYLEKEIERELEQYLHIRFQFYKPNLRQHDTSAAFFQFRKKDFLSGLITKKQKNT